MQYGPVSTPTSSPLAFDDKGAPCTWWECGIPKGVLTLLPPFAVDIPINGGGVARAKFPSGKARVLVDDQGREKVTLHWGLAAKPQAWGLTRAVVLGIHVFAEERADGFVGVTVVPNWGTLDPKKPGSWPGAVRFEDIRIVLPQGWVRVGGSFGPPGDWYGGPRCWTSRRMAFVPPGNAAGFANAQRWLVLADLQVNGHASLGPARHKIPPAKNSRHEPLQGGVGAGPLYSDSIYAGGGMVSGFGIVPQGGWEGSTNAARTYEADVWRVLSGHPCAAFHAQTGEPIWPDEWPKFAGFPMTDGYLRWDYWNAGAVQGTLVGTFGWSKSVSGPKEFNPGPSSSRYTILSIQKKDAAHLIRAIQILTAAWWETRSFAAWLGLRMLAVDVVSSGILRGANLYLRERWTFKALATAIAISPPGQERDDFLDERDLALARLSQTIHLNGWARAGAYPNSDNGESWAMGMPHEYATAAAWQLAFYVDGLYDLLRVAPLVSITPQRATWLLTEALSKLVDGPLTHHGSPPTHVGVIKNGQVEMPVSAGTADRAYANHSNHDLHALTLCRLWTGDQKYRTLAAKLGYPPPPDWAAIPNAYP